MGNALHIQYFACIWAGVVIQLYMKAQFNTEALLQAAH